MSITASEARKRLYPLITEVNEDQEAVEIVSKNGTAYLVPENEYRGWKETEYLLRSPAAAERLLTSVRNVEAGHIRERELLNPEQLATIASAELNVSDLLRRLEQLGISSTDADHLWQLIAHSAVGEERSEGA